MKKITLKESLDLNNDEVKKLLSENQNFTFEVLKTNCTIDITVKQKDSVDEFMEERIKGIKDLMDRVLKVKL